MSTNTSRLQTWRPDRLQLFKPSLCPSAISADQILTMGVMQATDFLLHAFGSWTQGDASRHSEELLSAFADAFSNCAKKQREKVAPIVKAIVRVGEPSLVPSEATLFKLTTLCCELGDVEAGRLLLQRCKTQAYGTSIYLSLIRLGAETSTDVDMELVFDVLDTMADNGVALSACFPLRLIMYGLSRMPSPPWETAAALMDLRLRLDHNLEGCVVSAFCSIAEKMTGPQVVNVVRFLDQLNPQLLQLPVACCCMKSKSKIEDYDHCPQRITLVDPMTIPLCSPPAAPEPGQPKHSVCFLYSCVRHLVERQKCVSSEHKFSRNLEALKTQGASMGGCNCEGATLSFFIVSLQMELMSRVGYTGACPKTYQERILVFVESMIHKKPALLPSLSVATTDAILMKELAAMGVRVVAQVE